MIGVLTLPCYPDVVGSGGTSFARFLGVSLECLGGGSHPRCQQGRRRRRPRASLRTPRPTSARSQRACAETARMFSRHGTYHSVRKERRVRPGFTPAEDIARFRPSRLRERADPTPSPRVGLSWSEASLRMRAPPARLSRADSGSWRRGERPDAEAQQSKRKEAQGKTRDEIQGKVLDGAQDKALDDAQDKALNKTQNKAQSSRRGEPQRAAVPREPHERTGAATTLRSADTRDTSEGLADQLASLSIHTRTMGI